MAEVGEMGGGGGCGNVDHAAVAESPTYKTWTSAHGPRLTRPHHSLLTHVHLPAELVRRLQTVAELRQAARELIELAEAARPGHDHGRLIPLDLVDGQGRGQGA